ncbi:MAG: TetR/AcrR family transcriptional regulator [Candidatus Dormibacteraeota bacterium]|nr:TetR/AcrR family transcriptional regulator [Candidatus Dormibacteraeota bacterium]
MSAPNKYTLKRRADRMRDTHARIAKAAYELHCTVGPSNTTVSAISERAGVQRHTFYRHFPDVASLYQACVAHGMIAMPLPDPAAWDRVKDARARASLGLSELYAYYRLTESAWDHLVPDIPRIPALYEANKPFFAVFGEIRRVLGQPFGTTGRRKKNVEALVGLAIDFRNWQALARGQGMDDGEIARLWASLLGCAAT